MHGFTHARAASLLGKLGAEGYRAAEIAPQLNAAHAQGLAVRNWGYPMSQRNAETDAVLGRDFARMRTGCCWRKGKLSDDAKKDPHNITRGQLDAILTRAAELNIPVIGFDELDSIRR